MRGVVQLAERLLAVARERMTGAAVLLAVPRERRA
jgi:hypothetical protein